MNRKGIFIVIDGIDGSGKKTQFRLLGDRLRKENFKVAEADFPQYSTPSCFFVEKYLNEAYGKEVNPYTASVFYAVDRFDSSSRLEKELAEGKVLISNRYVSANIGHQGGKIQDKVEREKYLDWLLDFEHNIMGIPSPDLTIFLNVPPEIAQQLVDKKDKNEREYVKGKKRDMHEGDMLHLKNASECYEYAANKYSDWVQVDCFQNGDLLSVEDTHRKIWEVVKPYLVRLEESQ